MTSPIGGHFELVDHDGRSVTDESYRGRFTMVFFGFTHCKKICPRALQRLSTILDEIVADDGKVQPLYITVDPERDSPEVMKAFLKTYPRFTGLTGTRPQIDEAKKAFRVFAERKDDPETPGGYDVPHTAITYLMGPDGSYRAHFPDSLDDETFKLRLKTALSLN